jgi:hypothetical protein
MNGFAWEDTAERCEAVRTPTGIVRDL